MLFSSETSSAVQWACRVSTVPRETREIQNNKRENKRITSPILTGQTPYRKKDYFWGSGAFLPLVKN